MKTSDRNSKLSQLLLNIPNHIVITSKWLLKLGYTYSNIERYKLSGWLEQLEIGVYKKQNDVVDWKGAIFGLQQQIPGEFHAGGLTSLELRGSSHFAKLSQERTVYMYSSPKNRVPQWFVKNKWNAQISLSYSNFLPEKLGIEKFDCEGFQIEVSSRERAILEVIYNIGKLHSFSECNLIMENLSTLRHALVQDLLEHCKSIKTVRVFLFLAKRNNHKWFKDVYIQKLDMGSGKRQIVSNGIYDPEFKITYPRDLFENDEIRF